ncbi:type VI secretion system Vgr family protein [Salinisphaera sp.]|uniref:type VI secretion system Vgr family protein n=1 Tax=Salinisphaera sp. TaxID=1914330 RepID=UPI000C5AACF3|nr:type VI secretion system Vgr family protein [Salinisphaera sp.]MBS63998.1 type VI secretion system tip protein VgrG [Salinisphaera sp.]
MNPLVDMLANALPGVTQTDRLLRLHTPRTGAALLPERVDGLEAISDGAGYRFELTALSTDPFIALEELIGQPVLLELMTAESRTELRPWHGHITAFERIGSNQGAARYRLVVEPWLAFLAYRTDSYVFQNASLIDIVESVFSDYGGQGALVPAWRWDLADRGVYPERSLTTQYRETDLAFVQRLLASQGLYYWFEHSGDRSADTLGTHTLVIADHNSAFQPEDGRPIRFHRADATETQDAIQHWRPREQRHSPQLRMTSWDYRTRDTRAVSAAGPQGPIAIDADDTPGQYAYPTREYGQRLADIQREAWIAGQSVIDGEGVERQLAPGERFVLVDHARGDAPSLCTRVHHRIKNNLSADILAEAERQLGGAEATPPAWHGRAARADGGIHEQGELPVSESTQNADEDDDFYHNAFTAIPADTVYRPALTDGHGLRLHPKPTIRSTQTAIVVGPPGAPVHTDRDHRIKVQFHWQRGASAHNQQAHPAGDDNAPASDAAGTWVRVSTAIAGANWGSHFVPRVGQEVIVRFLEGDIDRPVVTGAVYNGEGEQDAQHNRVSGAVGAVTGNAPAWFAGQAGEHAHPAVLSGLKTQALSTSGQGTGGYNQLVFDATPKQLRTQLSTTEYVTSLALGHLKHQTDNQRGTDRGHGAELTTQAYGSLRAGQGVLLTTERGAEQMRADGAQSALGQAHGLVKSLAEAADAQQATVEGDPKVADRPALNALEDTQESIAATASGTGTTTPNAEAAIKTTLGGSGDVPAWARPDLIASAPAGIAALTPHDHIVSAGKTLSATAGDINIATQNDHVAAVALGLRLYTQGRAAGGSKPNQETGIALHAATGPVTAQAQSAKAKLAAEQSVTIASTQADVNVSAMKHILLTAAGSGLEIKGANITLTAPGAVKFHAGQHVLTGPGSGTPESLSFAKTELRGCAQQNQSAAGKGGALA